MVRILGVANLLPEDGNAAMVGMLNRDGSTSEKLVTLLVCESGCKTGLLVFTLCVAGCGLGSFDSDVPSRSEEMQCVKNLQTLHLALQKYVSMYGDLPRGQDGEVSIDPLTDANVQDMVGLDGSVFRCRSDENMTRPSYVLNPALCITDLGSNSATVAACESTPNHGRARMQDRTRIVLIGDGSRVVMNLPQKEQNEWYRLFLLGDKRACTVISRSGAKGNWASSDVMWYVGQPRGYVPNEL